MNQLKLLAEELNCLFHLCAFLALFLKELSCLLSQNFAKPVETMCHASDIFNTSYFELYKDAVSDRANSLAMFLHYPKRQRDVDDFSVSYTSFKLHSFISV